MQKDQQTSEFQWRMEAHVVGMTRLAKNLSPTLYAEPTHFAPIFTDFYNQQQDHMTARSLRAHFATVEDMENYFRDQDREHMRE